MEASTRGFETSNANLVQKAAELYRVSLADCSVPLAAYEQFLRYLHAASCESTS